MSGLAAVGEEISAAGKLAAADRGVAGDRRLDPGPARHRRAEGPLAARHRRGHDQGRVRDHRARRRHELAQPLDLARAPTATARAERPEDLHLRRRARRRRARGRAQPARRRARSGCRRCAIVDVDAPGFTRDAIPMPYIGPDQQWTLFFDDVELEEERLIGGESGGLGPVFDGLNPERIMGAAIACGAGPAGAREGRGLRQRARRSGARRSAPTRASPTRWPRRRSSSSWRG